MNRTIWARDFEHDVWAPMVCNAGGGASAGASSGKQQAEQAPVQNPAFPLLQSNVDSARNVAAQPFQAYGGPMVAGTNATQNQAANMARTAGGDVMSGIQKYQSPYTQQVIDPALADIERQRQMATNQGDSNATFAHAFGGSRQGVSDSLTNEAALRAAATTSGALRDQGFTRSADLAQTDATRGLQASTVLGNLGQQEQSTQQAGLTAQLNEFMRQQNYPVEMQRLISEAMGLVPGGVSNAGTSSGKQSSWNAAANAWV